MANHSDPESCVRCCEVAGEALTGATDRPAIEPRNNLVWDADAVSEAEGNMVRDEDRQSCADPTRSENLCMSGSRSHGSSEISSVSGGSGPDGAGKVNDRNPAVNAGEKSDTPIVPKKPSNNGDDPAEVVEGRGVAKGNAGETPASRTPCRNKRASMGLEGVRVAARQDKRVRFTALLHHLTPGLLLESFYELKRTAAAGVDGVTWREYEAILGQRLPELHREVHTGSYRAQPSRRVFIAKADGRQRPLGIASLEDKIVQQAVVRILSAIYEEDFLGFSYGFRPGRGAHDALDALSAGIMGRKVNWILDADIRAFFDELDHEWLLRFLEHRIADRRILRLIRKWLRAGVIEDGRRVLVERGTPQGAVVSPLLANIYLHYVLDLWVQQWRQQPGVGDLIVVRYADDSVFGFEREETAQRFLAALQERLARFGLALHPEKTRLIEFGRFAARNRDARGQDGPETFDFLGFTHCCGRTRRGRFQVVRLAAKKRMRATLHALHEVLLRRRHEPIKAVGDWLRRVVQGYFNYHAVPTNLHRLRGFRSEVCRLWRQTLQRRSQRPRMPWDRFRHFAHCFIPYCRTLHPYPEARFYASRP